MIEFKVKLPSLPPIPPMPNLGRHIMITALVVSLILSGTSMYVSLAAPQRAIFVPSTVGFEGQLADSQGVPVADGQYGITFTLYDAATGGTVVWTETQPAVDVKDGLYSVQLGSVTTLQPDDFNADRWLGVKVGSDAEMSPRIPVGAVPFALNAQHAMGLQGNDVSPNLPQDKNALLWDNGDDEWEPRGVTFPDLAPVGSNASPNDLLKNYRSGAILRWKATDTVEVSAGELMINGYMRRNTNTVDVKFDGDAGGNGPNRGLDTGTAQSNTTYYVYAVADDAESTFDLIVSASDTAPTGRTNHRKIGSFVTEAGNTNIKEGTVANVTETAHFAPGARVYSGINLTLNNFATTVLAFNSERFDNDALHDISTNTSRLTATKPGMYQIFGNVKTYFGSCNYSFWPYVRLNGSTYIFRGPITMGGGSDYDVGSISTVYWLKSGDYVELVIYYSNNCGNGTVQAIANYSPEFGMVWIGP